jgi:hypothetical protein
MPGKAMDVYLNDHLAGATLGVALAEQIRERHEGTPLGEVLTTIAGEIEEDRQTLLGLMERMDVSTNPVKQATGWLGEKASRVKFSGAMSGEPEQSAFLALESLTLGVEGKRRLWSALKSVANAYPALGSIDLDDLIARARAQQETLERERLAAGVRALGNAA